MLPRSFIEKALQQDRANRTEAVEHARLVARYESLTPREREVLPLLVSGLLNKQATFELGITEYTVQIHRGHIMRKMKADSFATLVKLSAKLKRSNLSRPGHLTGIHDLTFRGFLRQNQSCKLAECYGLCAIGNGIACLPAAR